MLIRSEDVRTIHNLGLRDRGIRFAIGALLLAPALAAATGMVLAPSGPQLDAWVVGMIIAAVYPLMTAMIGVDPIYRLFGVRSCGDSGTNQCGTLPYQLKARKGEAPAWCEAESHSLEACHDEPVERPRHPDWSVSRPVAAAQDEPAHDRTQPGRG